ncbi:MAG: hypothetical protein RLZZ292_1679 [Bacteroidota bacterium]|jgi:hypothetical protein
MKKNTFFSILLFLSNLAAAQNTLFDDSKVSSIYINFPYDSLQILYQDVLSDHYYSAQFVFDDGIKKDTLEDVGFRLRGNTSRGAGKKSFKVSFNQFVPGRKYQGAKKINLNGSHNDPTMIREKLFYDIWNKAGMPSRRTAFARVYINDDYYGLYTNLEELDKEWLKKNYSDNKGNLYKCTYPADLDYMGTDQNAYKFQGSSNERAYHLQTNEIEDDYSDLTQLITTLHQPTNAAWIDAIQKKLDVSATLKAFALEVAAGHWDDYAYNQNNYFLYHNPTDDQFQFITYDADNTFGVDWFGKDWAQRDCFKWLPSSSSQKRPLISKLLEVPQFRILYKAHLAYISEKIIHPDTIFPRIDALHDLIRDAAYEDSYKSLDYKYDNASFDDGFDKTVDSHTPYGIKPFLALRQKTMKAQVLLAEEEIENKPFTKTLKFYPNPTSDFIHLENETTNQPIEITNSLGQIVLKQPSNTFSKIDVSALQSGFYFIKVGQEMGMFLKE